MTVDNLVEAKRLMEKLKRYLPISAYPAPPLLKMFKQRNMPTSPKPLLQVSDLFYMGDEGGICCALEPISASPKEDFIVSITHLVFDPNHELAPEIIAYQRRRYQAINKNSKRKGFSTDVLSEQRQKTRKTKKSRGFWTFDPPSS
jgi:hypothetical protein